MHTQDRHSRQDDWRDEVAGDDADFGWARRDVDEFIADAKDIARMVVEVTFAPLRAFAEGLPRSMAFEGRAWRDDAARHVKRHARRASRRRRW